jgi:hypothetical protein
MIRLETTEESREALAQAVERARQVADPRVVDAAIEQRSSRRPPSALLFEAAHGSCGCSLLSDDADWDAENWAMRQEVLDGLGQMIVAVAEHGPRPLSLAALWNGDQPTGNRLVTTKELSDLARTSRLGTHIQYELE